MLEFERSYWGTCQNTFDEDQKHYVYAALMHIPHIGYSLDANHKSVLDVGGGPTSMLLKCVNLKRGMVIDPLIDLFPAWTKARYQAANIATRAITGEDNDEQDWDEVWVYNVLQHVIDPIQVLERCKRAGRVLRLFEWIDVPAHEGHPHELTRTLLRPYVPNGYVIELKEHGCYGRAFVSA